MRFAETVQETCLVSKQRMVFRDEKTGCNGFEPLVLKPDCVGSTAL